MIKTDSDIFLHIPDDSGERILHPGRVVEVSETFFAAAFEEEDLVLEDGMDILIYYEMNRNFMQQAGRIDSVVETEPKIMVRLETTGNPVSAESRECCRASGITADLAAKFGPEDNCRVADVSMTGFALYANKSYKTGNRVEAVLYHGGEALTGTVTIQSVKELPTGKIRYGVYCTNDPKSGSRLKQGLSQVYLAVQRQQLARLSGLGS
jgi:hypothetical protein